MTDEEMAEESLISYRKESKWAGKMFMQDENTCYKDGFLAGLEAGRPEWHKVADGDLPKKVGDYITNIGVLTYDNYGNGVHKWHTPYCEACDYTDEADDDEVIAWCEIPKFDDKE